MWINKAHYQNTLDLLHRTIRDLQQRLEHEQQDRRATAAQTTVLRQVEMDARVQCAAALAYYDTARVQLNELKLERATYLAKLLKVELPVATIQAGPLVDPPGVTFEDMGDAADRAGFSSANLVPEAPPLAGREESDTIASMQLFTDPEEVDPLDVGLGAGTVVRSPTGV